MISAKSFQHFLDKCLTELPEDKNVEGPFFTILPVIPNTIKQIT